MNTLQRIGRLRVPAVLAASLALTALAGCGDSSKATVSGKVTYKGAPVTGGTLTLHPASGADFPIVIKADGSFYVTDAPIGQMAVAIETDSVPSNTMPPGMTPPKDTPVPGQTASLPKDMPPPKDYSPAKPSDTSAGLKKVAIPSKYKDPTTSGLTWDIKGGSNAAKEFDLTD